MGQPEELPPVPVTARDRPHGGGEGLEAPPLPFEAVGQDGHDLFRALPVSFLIFRIYCQTHDHDAQLNAALQSVLGDAMDAKTNM